MRFWDASAVVPLLTAEERSGECTALLRQDPTMVVWALTPVEVLSAVHRKRRDAGLAAEDFQQARVRLESLREAWSEIRNLELVRRRAERLLAVHELRAADALPLAAALVVCEEDPRKMPLVSLDDRLCEAARREGFRVEP